MLELSWGPLAELNVPLDNTKLQIKRKRKGTERKVIGIKKKETKQKYLREALVVPGIKINNILENKKLIHVLTLLFIFTQEKKNNLSSRFAFITYLALLRKKIHVSYKLYNTS